MDSLDYNGPKINEGSKGVLLGLGEAKRELPREFHGSLPSECETAVPFCAGCLLVDGASYDKQPEDNDEKTVIQGEVNDPRHGRSINVSGLRPSRLCRLPI